VEVLDFTGYFTLYSFVIQKKECAAVQEGVKVFADFHRSLSLSQVHEVIFSPSWAKMPLG
jgi:hypothetical protein